MAITVLRTRRAISSEELSDDVLAARALHGRQAFRLRNTWILRCSTPIETTYTSLKQIGYCAYVHEQLKRPAGCKHMQKHRDWNQLTLEIEPDFYRRIEAAASGQGLPVQHYIVVFLREAFSNGAELQAVVANEWSRLSVPVFARDWDSEADSIYDELA